MSDRILIEGLACYGYHGVRPEEQALGQRFVVDLGLELDLQPAGSADDLSLSVDYGEVCQVVREVVEGPSRLTLEAVAEQAAARLLERYPRLQAVRVRLAKPGAPIAGAHFETVAVEIIRRRTDRHGD